MRVNHLALVVRDQGRSRRFYERYLGFDAGPPQLYEDGVLVIRDQAAFDLALAVGEPASALPRFFHFGFTCSSAEAVWKLMAGMRDGGISTADEESEPGFASFKCLDPDGYKIEVYWEVAPT